jgi:PAS domain S-box-containing protein
LDQANIYRTIFERSDIGVYQTLVEGGVVEANPAMARMFG